MQGKMSEYKIIFKVFVGDRFSLYILISTLNVYEYFHWRTFVPYFQKKMKIQIQDTWVLGE